jgi:hypothetical protein
VAYVGLSPDLLLLKRDDLLGAKQLDVSMSQSLQQLQGLRGLQAVKDSVQNLLGLIRWAAASRTPGQWIDG